MSLKDLVKHRNSTSYVLKPLDTYLMSLSAKDDDRRWDINSPSSAGKCIRGNVYSRLGYERDGNTVTPRLRRIFDNGTYVHIRLQNYLLEQGILLMDEVPAYNDPLQIQGHSDGLLKLRGGEGAILEIKSINGNSFSNLIDAKDEHKKQAQVYLYCLEKRRKVLKKRYKTPEQLEKYLNSAKYKKFIKAHYTHLKSGHKYTKEEKFNFQLECHRKSDRILYQLRKPLTKMIFIYESKDTQEIKEFLVTYNEKLMNGLKEYYREINSYVENGEIPPRPEEAKNKNCSYCRWCNFKIECWVV